MGAAEKDEQKERPPKWEDALVFDGNYLPR